MENNNNNNNNNLNSFEKHVAELDKKLTAQAEVLYAKIREGREKNEQNKKKAMFDEILILKGVDDVESLIDEPTRVREMKRHHEEMNKTEARENMEQLHKAEILRAREVLLTKLTGKAKELFEEVCELMDGKETPVKKDCVLEFVSKGRELDEEKRNWWKLSDELHFFFTYLIIILEEMNKRSHIKWHLSSYERDRMTVWLTFYNNSGNMKRYCYATDVECFNQIGHVLQMHLEYQINYTTLVFKSKNSDLAEKKRKLEEKKKKDLAEFERVWEIKNRQALVETDNDDDDDDDEDDDFD